MSRWVNPIIFMDNIGLNHLDNGRPNKLKCLGFEKLGENTNHLFFSSRLTLVFFLRVWFFLFESSSSIFPLRVLVFDSSSSCSILLPRLRSSSIFFRFFTNFWFHHLLRFDFSWFVLWVFTISYWFVSSTNIVLWFMC